MSATNLQLVKWSFPAFALLVGFFWYKRRRVDKVDPGGVCNKSCTDKNRESYTTEATEKKANVNLFDSGINIDDSCTLNSSYQTAEEVIPSPRRVSESLDIPTRKSVSQGISIRSGASANNIESWYNEIEDVPEPKAVVLGSNPKSTNFDMMSQNNSAMNFDTKRSSAENKSVQVFENVTEEEQSTSNGLSKPSVYVENHVSSVTAYNHIEDCSKTFGAEAINDPKNQGEIICERDSANHSPVSGVLEGSVTDDIRSEGSTDSGKGGSINGKAKNKKATAIFEFAISQSLVGKLIGKRGTFLQYIKSQAGVVVTIKRHPTSRYEKMCTIEGPSEGINVALHIIRLKFPEDKFPNFSREPVPAAEDFDAVVWNPELMYVPLVEGVNNDTSICFISKPNHFFVQLPTHPTYPAWKTLDYTMTETYDNLETPLVPQSLTPGMMVVTKVFNKWARALVIQPDPNGMCNLIRLVDHGGFWMVPTMSLRRIKSDWLSLPFQAVEVYLANVRPVSGKWPEESYDVLGQLCDTGVSQLQIEGYIDDHVYVSLYYDLPEHGIISLADELIARGFAEPVTLDHIVPEEHLQAA